MKRNGWLLLILISFNTRGQINEGKLITKDGYLEIPFTETRKEFHADATLKDDKYSFMLDSGAPAFISREIQDKYKFPLIFKMKVKDSGGETVYTEVVKLDTIKFGPFIFTDIPAIVVEMKNSPLECLHIAGNIGSNMFRYLILQFDKNENRIAFTDNEKLLKKHMITSRPMKLDHQSDVFFPVKIDNNITDTVHFDTGDGAFYNISKRTAGTYSAAFPGDVIRNGFGVTSIGIGGVGESFQQYIMKPKTIGIASETFSGGNISIAGNDKSRIGRDLLNYGILQLNYPDSAFSFQQYAPSWKAGNFDYGFKIVPDNDKMYVGCVWKSTSAEMKGLAEGDLVLKVNNTDFSLLSKCDVDEAIRKELLSNTDSITVTFQHKKHKPKTITLEKRAL